MNLAFAAFNARSSSIKCSVVQAAHDNSLALACQGEVEKIDAPLHQRRQPPGGRLVAAFE
jgi:hypothetical protein